MAGRWATTCKVGSADFSDCRVELIDAGGFLSDRVGSSDNGNDGTPIVQSVERLRRGVKFGLKMDSAIKTLLSTMINDIKTAEAIGNAVRGEFEEGLIDVDIYVVPDYGSGENWVTWEKHSEDMYEGVTIRLQSKGDYPVI